MNLNTNDDTDEVAEEIPRKRGFNKVNNEIKTYPDSDRISS
jgi:hypothetical protein